ncbi:uncharacterized protein [Magallana gigas]|uniref:uncharacterized protein n=1 Tax=Magallana gigas TaxID=29159 RepID=UPI0033422F93
MSNGARLEKKGASKWTYTALTEIGVEFEEECIPLRHFKNAFNERLRNADDLVRRKNIIMSETDYNLSWNYKVPLKTRKRQEQIRTIIQDLGKLNGAAAITENGEEATRGHEIERDSEEYIRWKTNLKEFFKGLWVILHRSGKPGAGVYTKLFDAFSRIVCLYPEPGNMYRRGIMIGGKEINEEATVRFETLPLFMESNSSDDSTPATLDYEPKLLLVTQVTTYDSFRYSWKPGQKFEQKHMASKVKGQHGIQLLIEIERSLFRRKVFGCICIGTYIIITQLEVNKRYAQELRDGKIQNPVKVKFSQPYDFLKEVDRKKIMDFLILISCVQSKHE